MYAIVATDNNWGIGKNNDLLYHLSQDMKFFKQMTIGKVVVMGRKTFESLPGKQPLKDRTNVVLSKHYLDLPGAIVVHSVNEFFTLFGHNIGNCVCIGGSDIYRLFLPFCDIVYRTHVYDESKKPDKYFPNLDNRSDWKLSEILKFPPDAEIVQEENDLKYVFEMYRSVPKEK